MEADCRGYGQSTGKPRWTAPCWTRTRPGNWQQHKVWRRTGLSFSAAPWAAGRPRIWRRGSGRAPSFWNRPSQPAAAGQGHVPGLQPSLLLRRDYDVRARFVRAAPAPAGGAQPRRRNHTVRPGAGTVAKLLPAQKLSRRAGPTTPATDLIETGTRSPESLGAVSNNLRRLVSVTVSAVENPCGLFQRRLCMRIIIFISWTAIMNSTNSIW